VPLQDWAMTNINNKPPLVCKTRSLREVDLKSTVSDNRLTLLLSDISLNHFVDDIARANGKIAPGPKIPIPELLFQMWKLGQQHRRAYSLQPLHDFAGVLCHAIGSEHMDMTA
jgi:hypothetical protein